MINILWQTNIFRLNMQTANHLVGQMREELHTNAIPLVGPAVEHFLAKGYGKRIDFDVCVPTMHSAVPTFCAVWFIKGGRHIFCADPRLGIHGTEQFVLRPWTSEVKDGDIFIFPSYVEYDYAAVLDSDIVTLDIVTTEQVHLT